MFVIIFWIVGIVFTLFVILAIIGAVIEHKETQKKFPASQPNKDTSLPISPLPQNLSHADISSELQDSSCTPSLIATEGPEKEETVFQKLEKLKIDSIDFTIKENPTIKKIINEMKKKGYLNSDYEGRVTKK